MAADSPVMTHRQTTGNSGENQCGNRAFQLFSRQGRCRFKNLVRREPVRFFVIFITCCHQQILGNCSPESISTTRLPPILVVITTTPG